jgi:hypothetical protein
MELGKSWKLFDEVSESKEESMLIIGTLIIFNLYNSNYYFQR